ncbi:unnamed protein product [Caenorhabditis sp. 36 PRJEB53466]|nr:unnamed protein product [Caenorhabditis sp. 36 PRJEB53466]
MFAYAALDPTTITTFDDTFNRRPTTLGAYTDTNNQTRNAKHLGVYLECKETSRSNLWSVNASVRIVLLRSDSEYPEDGVFMDFERKFDVNSKKIKFPHFKNWGEAISPDNKFVEKDGWAVLEAHITVKDDVGIHEKGKKLHVGKQILAENSKFFYALFYSDFEENGQAQIEIKDVVHSEFVDLLNFIYQANMEIESYNVAHLLKLADQFGVATVIERCEQFLLYSTDLRVVDLLKFAEMYKLSDLQDQCLKELETTKEVIELSEHPNFGNLGDGTHNVLLKRLIELIKKG